MNMRITAPLALLLLALTASSAHAQQEHIIRGEAGIGIIFPPQADRFQNPGFALGVGYEYRLLEMLGLEARYNVLGFSAKAEDGWGVTHDLALAARIYPAPSLEAGRLWIGVGPALALTGGEARFALEGGVGFEFQPSDHLLVGPMMRLTWVIEPSGGALQDDDAVFLQIGATIAYTTGGRRDRDDDGILDGDDQCPEEPEDLDDFQDGDGCPEADNDSDGIPDDADQCPVEPETANGFEDEDGCPDETPAPADRDDDGVVDDADACPDEPEDADGFEDEDGCPDADNDGDGIADASDACPTDAETVNGHQDEDGCPDEVPRETVELGQRIYFAMGSSTLTAAARPTLDEVVRVLRAHPEVRVRVEGYTDRVGIEANNNALSRRRALGARRQLIRRGISADRIEMVAYGETQSGGEDGVANPEQRRVEFRVIE